MRNGCRDLLGRVRHRRSDPVGRVDDQLAVEGCGVLGEELVQRAGRQRQQHHLGIGERPGQVGDLRDRPRRPLVAPLEPPRPADDGSRASPDAPRGPTPHPACHRCFRYRLPQYARLIPFVRCSLPSPGCSTRPHRAIPDRRPVRPPWSAPPAARTSAMIASACWWFSSVEPAQASVATRTFTPASAAASTVEITQQSVVTPATTSSAPALAASSGPHLPKVGASSVGRPANRSTRS